MLLFTIAAVAQESGGATINGTITDPSGALIAGAKVTATQTTTGAQRSTQSSNAGLYSLSALNAGTYDVIVEAPGFKQAKFAADSGPLDPNCGCRVCRRYSRAYLRHLYAANEVLAQVLNTVHNLSFYLDTMRSVRHSIALGNKAQFLSGEQSRAKS